MTTNHKSLSITAKCAICSIKAELYVCPHCDKVTCQACLETHQLKLIETLKTQWDLSKTKYLDLYRLSDNNAKDTENIENEATRVRLLINQRFADLVKLLENEKDTLLDKLDEQHIQSNSSNANHGALQDVFNSINQRLESIFQDSNASYEAEDFLLEIEHFNTLVQNREQHIQMNSLKYPSLTPAKSICVTDIFGELRWSTSPTSNYTLTKPLKMINNRSSNPISNGNTSSETSSEPQEDSGIECDKMTLTTMTQKQKQWTIDAVGVPHFLCVLSKKNHLLFACDKFGSIDLYQLDSTSPKYSPRHLRQFDLFPGNTTSAQPQIIETFTVYTPFIVVSAHLNDQADTSSIYFFDHRGIKQADACVLNFPVRQLSADPSLKCLWGIDRHQHSVYYHQLPTNVQQLTSCLEHREEFVKYNRSMEPIRIAHNQKSIAIVERNSQCALIYDKQTRKKIDEVENLLRSKGIFRLWNLLFRDDNSMILKLDEDLPPNSRPPSINHIVLELDPNGIPISQIERTSVYGLAVGPHQEILLGCKRHQQNGVIECYI